MPEKKGEIIQDTSAFGSDDIPTAGMLGYYKVTNSSKKNLTVELVETNSDFMTQKYVVPDTITCQGVVYKVTSIGSKAFSGSEKKLKSVIIGKNVKTIGDKAFYKCSALTKITIPSNVTKIGKEAFRNCKKLKSITLKTTKLKSSYIGKNAFKGIHANAKIKVPKSIYENIKVKRNWRKGNYKKVEV